MLHNNASRQTGGSNLQLSQQTTGMFASRYKRLAILSWSNMCTQASSRAKLQLHTFARTQLHKPCKRRNAMFIMLIKSCTCVCRSVVLNAIRLRHLPLHHRLPQRRRHLCRWLLPWRHELPVLRAKCALSMHMMSMPQIKHHLEYPAGWAQVHEL